jgi:quercetin dioxygenase-like cupin family protein
MKKQIILILTIAMAIISCKNQNSSETAIFPKGKKVETNFTGAAFVNMLVTDDKNVFNSQVYDVVFEAGTRNFWHSHPGGQILLVTAGRGYYQERGKSARQLKKGDVVEILPNIEHWHGAAPDSEFTHIGISTNTQKGATVWRGPLTDTEYSEATK